MPFLSRSRDAESPAPLPYDPASPEGLAARWVQWVAAAGPLANPVEDEDGRHAAANQPDDVWFLAGTSGKSWVRSCVVPLGRPLFMPVVNYWAYPAEEAPERMGAALGSVTVDGVAQQVQEIATPVPFVVAGARLNGVTGKKRPVPTTVWGLWAHVAPLAPRAHEVVIAGGDGYGFTVDVTYRLVVGGVDPGYAAR